MKHTHWFCALSALAFLGLSTAQAASIKTYQVTGPIVELTEQSITVQKGKEKWEIVRDAATKVQGELKKGTKVTIQYKMTATQIEAK